MTVRGSMAADDGTFGNKTLMIKTWEAPIRRPLLSCRQAQFYKVGLYSSSWDRRYEPRRLNGASETVVARPISAGK